MLPKALIWVVSSAARAVDCNPPIKLVVKADHCDTLRAEICEVVKPVTSVLLSALIWVALSTAILVVVRLLSCVELMALT